MSAKPSAPALQFTLLSATPGSTYVPVYLSASEHPGRFASVNAGNSNQFFVGGGGLNAAFANAVAQPNSYLPLQTALFNSATSRIATKANYAATDPVQFAMVQKPAQTGVFAFYEGTVFIDIFQPGTAPHGNADNYAMIYVCPPNGSNHPSTTAFLTAVTATASNVIDAVRYYNTKLAPTQPSLKGIKVVRLFLFSSGIYRPANTTVAQVAKAVFTGLTTALAKGPTGLKLIELPNAQGEYSSIATLLPGKAV